MPVKYDLVMDEEAYHDEHWSIKILEGDLEGVVFQYDTVKFREEEGADGAVLDFDILYIEGEEKAAAHDGADQIFGDILVGIIEENLREMAKDGNGNSNTEAPAK
jgi:hypothetical protein